MSFRQSLGMRLRRAYLTMHRRFNARFAELGLTADQFVLLTLLAEEDGITQRELARRSASDANTITAMLNRLQRQGLVERRAHATDGRAWCVSLTVAGRETQRKLEAHAAELHAHLNALLAPGEREAFAEGLAKVAEGMAPPGRVVRGERPA
jgi:DNA-binding MarR family transcriptional regulator